MYQSPIEIITKKMRTQFEDNVFKAIQDYGIVVDKDELIKALKYDRDQYEKGYRDGLFLRGELIAGANDWISVEERLPEIEGDARTWGELKIRKSVRVLCACVQKSGKTFVKEGYCEVWGDSQRAYWKIPGSIDKVTHWMPLPEAPKGGAE